MNTNTSYQIDHIDVSRFPISEHNDTQQRIDKQKAAVNHDHLASQKIDQINDFISAFDINPTMNFLTFQKLANTCGFKGDMHANEKENRGLNEDSAHGQAFRSAIVDQFRETLRTLEMDLNNPDLIDYRATVMANALADSQGCFAKQATSLMEKTVALQQTIDSIAMGTFDKTAYVIEDLDQILPATYESALSAIEKKVANTTNTDHLKKLADQASRLSKAVSTATWSFATVKQLSRDEAAPIQTLQASEMITTIRKLNDQSTPTNVLQTLELLGNQYAKIVSSINQKDQGEIYPLAESYDDAIALLSEKNDKLLRTTKDKIKQSEADIKK